MGRLRGVGTTQGRGLTQGRGADSGAWGEAQCRILRGSEPLAPMALTAFSRPVVVDGGSFLDALFASAGQDRRVMEHRPQDRSPRRRAIDWRLDDRGAFKALKAQLGSVFNDLQVCNSMLICSLESVSGRYEVRTAPYIDLDFASFLGRVACSQEAARPDPDPR